VSIPLKGLFKNLNDAILASLGNLRTMQIKAAITENLVFINISEIIHGIKIILVSIPTFCWVKNQKYGQLVSFEKSWPGGCNMPLSKLVVTMAVKKRQ